jgi:hypothetical protein
VFEFRGSVVIELEYERGGGLEAAYAAVTEWLEEFHESNAVLWTLSITGTEKRGGSNGDKK